MRVGNNGVDHNGCGRFLILFEPPPLVTPSVGGGGRGCSTVYAGAYIDSSGTYSVIGREELPPFVLRSLPRSKEFYFSAYPSRHSLFGLEIYGTAAAAVMGAETHKTSPHKLNIVPGK